MCAIIPLLSLPFVFRLREEVGKNYKNKNMVVLRWFTHIWLHISVESTVQDGG